MRGVAWAAKKSLLDKYRLYDAVNYGKNDDALVFAIYGRYREFIESLNSSEQQLIHYLRWAIPFYNAIEDRIGFIQGRVRCLRDNEIMQSKMTAIKKMRF